MISALHRFNQRHPWSHNDRLHGWILRHLPERRGHVVDIGCGRGRLLTRLAPEFARATGVEPDPASADAARCECVGLAEVSVAETGFLDHPEPADCLVAVASLHHLGEEVALRHARTLLNPGGRLLVVGLARPETITDHAVDLLSVVLNPLVGILLHPRPDVDPEPSGPVAPPRATLREIRAIAEQELPGARIRRRLFFRYTFEWTAPFADVMSGDGPVPLT